MCIGLWAVSLVCVHVYNGMRNSLVCMFLLSYTSEPMLGQRRSSASIDENYQNISAAALLLTLPVSCLSSRESQYAVSIDRSLQVHKPGDQQHRGRGQFK